MTAAHLVNPDDANVTMEMIARIMEEQLDLPVNEYQRSLSLFCYIADLIGFSYEQMQEWTGIPHGTLREKHHSLARAGSTHLYMKGTYFDSYDHEIARKVLKIARQQAKKPDAAGTDKRPALDQIVKDVEAGLYTYEQIARECLIGKVTTEYICKGVITKIASREVHKHRAGAIILAAGRLRAFAEKYQMQEVG